MIYTNRLKIDFDLAAIDRDFIIYKIERSSNNYHGSLIPDATLQDERILATAYDYGSTCYLLYRRAPLEREQVKHTLESLDADIRVQQLPAAAVPRAWNCPLAQLLFNALPALTAAGQMYHNLTGKLYYTDTAWHRGRGEHISCFWALRLALKQDTCLTLQVTTFRPADPKWDAGDPWYLFDQHSFALRRALRNDPDRAADCYVIGTRSPNRKNTVAFLDFLDSTEFERSKVGVLQRFLQDVREQLAPYLTVQLTAQAESAHCGTRKADTKLAAIRARLAQVPLYCEDTVADEASAALAAALRRKLAAFSGLTLREGPPQPGSALLRIVHNKEFYAACPEQDPHQNAPADCAVQHLTVEDFALGDDDREDAALKKVLQELAIKLDVRQGVLTCYDWTTRGFAAPIYFVRRDADTCRRLCVQPDGRLVFDAWACDPLRSDAEQQKLSELFLFQSGKTDRSVEGLVYQDSNAIQIIRRTERITLPDVDALGQLLHETRDREMLEMAPLLDAVQDFSAELPQADHQNMQLILDDLRALPSPAARREVRAALHVRTALGRRLNDELYARTGVRVSSGIKQKERREALLGAAVDIRCFDEGPHEYYYCGTHAESLNRALPRACVIRKVSSTAGQADFKPYLPLMEVDFVRAAGWTVLPFPFKYLREWTPQA